MCAGTLDDLVGRMERELDGLDGARRHFHATYLRTTRAVVAEIERGGFADGAWLTRWDLVFASLYLDALDADRRGAPVSEPWRVAFSVADREPDLPPLRHVLFGMNAHINYDLPQALVAVVSSADFDDPAVLRGREADHRHLDSVLQSRVAAEGAELDAVSRVRRVDRLLGPANRAATRRFVAESRAKVWRNAVVLDRARRGGPEGYVVKLAELERLCAAKVRELAAPGPVLLKLARRGFGVLLPEA
jgi:hypothetical protein